MDTNYPAGHPMAAKVWAKKLYAETIPETVFGQYLDASGKSMVHEKNELTKQPGDRITYGLRAKLVGRGTHIDGDREGEEEALSIYADTVVVGGLAHQVKSRGKLSDQRVPFEFREEAREGLSLWWQERLDTAFFNQLCGNTAQTDELFIGFNSTIAPSVARTVRAGGHTGDTSLGASDTMNLDLIDKSLEKAATVSPLVRPFKVGGDNYYVMFLHDYQVYDLTKNTNDGQWFSIQKAALTSGERFKDNPLFTGALGIYKGVILKKSNYVTTGCDITTATTAVTTARRAVLCGAQAMAYARAGRSEMEWIEEKFQYKSQLGVSAEQMFGMKKIQFNSVDFGVITVPTYAIAHS